MASTGKCEYCGGVILSSDKKCPTCGAANLLYVEDAPSVILTPHTIKELAEYCAERNMPLHRMRFFIGEDYKKPKAFGIFQNDKGEFVVYKNKANGSRSIRYKGFDEKYAVKELYMKLLEECHNRNIWPDTPDGKPPKIKRQAGKKTKEMPVILTILIVIGIFLALMGVIVGCFLVKASLIRMGILEEFKLGTISFICFALYYLYNYVYIRIVQSDKQKETEGCATKEIPFFAKKDIILGILFATVVAVINILLKHPVFYVDLSLLALLSLVASWGIPLGVFVLKELLNSLLIKFSPQKKGSKNKKEKKWSWKSTAVMLAVSTLIITLVPVINGNKKEGYYQTSSGIFYKIDNDVYEYTDSGWDYTSYSSDYLDSSDYVYMYDDAWDSDWDMDSYDRFEETTYYDSYHSSDSDYDYGGSYDSWDSGGTDWDSDW